MPPEYNSKHSQEADFQRIIELLEEISSKLDTFPVKPLLNVVPAKDTCSLCGLSFDGMTSFHCARSGCPVSTRSLLA